VCGQCLTERTRSVWRPPGSPAHDGSRLTPLNDTIGSSVNADASRGEKTSRDEDSAELGQRLAAMARPLNDVVPVVTVHREGWAGQMRRGCMQVASGDVVSTACGWGPIEWAWGHMQDIGQGDRKQAGGWRGGHRWAQGTSYI